ncbi:MAG: hypothetical protein WCY86_06460 [Spirosomataceae bacterium]
MALLSENWITDGGIDFELKKYIVLAYEQKVSKRFTQHKIFPDLKEARLHYQNCISLRKERAGLKKSMPKTLVAFDLKKKKAVFEENFEESSKMLEIDDILSFSIPVLSGIVNRGEEIKSEASSRLNFGPIGILPLRNDEGYLFLYRTLSRETSVYEYRVTVYNPAQERFVKTRLIDSFQKAHSTTFEQHKVRLIRKFKHLPNPATYIVETVREYPVEEALLPLAKELILKEFNATNVQGKGPEPPGFKALSNT